jgi:hypothetical protein
VRKNCMDFLDLYFTTWSYPAERSEADQGPIVIAGCYSLMILPSRSMTSFAGQSLSNTRKLGSSETQMPACGLFG